MPKDMYKNVLIISLLVTSQNGKSSNVHPQTTQWYTNTTEYLHSHEHRQHGVIAHNIEGKKCCMIPFI